MYQCINSICILRDIIQSALPLVLHYLCLFFLSLLMCFDMWISYVLTTSKYAYFSLDYNIGFIASNFGLKS